MPRLLIRTHGKHIMLNCKEVGRKPPTFSDASIIATELLNSGYEFDQGSVIYNRFRYRRPVSVEIAPCVIIFKQFKASLNFGGGLGCIASTCG